ncbi:uncharacterized protein BX663DRAFT_559957 [Cokeromyces recurvatus]|uniref:uncharacterized protein n=1 Tax=Cokeromyces recurvatus TaxID=90255 RepID=UPI0022207B08|nr:uncharacterized protein BX663DRAFT_559957 [Cokeromyces recurvatus]KAI7904250.1 hypothetical protein BX663DRAFT_559957 [Cokeromyces recurvatus]
MYIIHLLLIVVLIVTKCFKAQQPNNTYSNNTIFQVLNDTTTSPAFKFMQFLQSSPDYQPILELLSNTSSNLTLFIPSDQVYYEVTGEHPPTLTDPSNNTTNSTTNGTEASTTTTSSSSSLLSTTTTITGSVTTMADPSFSMGLPNIFTVSHQAEATSIYSLTKKDYIYNSYDNIMNNPNPEKRIVLSMRAEVLSKFGSLKMPQPQLGIHKAIDQGNWEAVTSDPIFANSFNHTDLAYYHLVNGSTVLTNTTMVLDSLLTNTTVNKWYSYSQLVVQQRNNLTVGNGLGNDANILADKTIQASNGIIYIIDKILIPPVSPIDTLSILENTTFFNWILSRSSYNSSLNTANNMTLFVPTNSALQNLNFTILTNETIDNFIKAHIISGVYYTTNMTAQPITVSSLAGTNLTLSNSDVSSNQSATVNEMHIIHSNILLNNGVMQLIDGILTFPVPQPPGSNPDDNPPNIGPFPPPVNSSSSCKLFKVSKLITTFIIIFLFFLK